MAYATTTEETAAKIRAWFQMQPELKPVGYRTIAKGIGEENYEVVRPAIALLMRDGTLEYAHDKPHMRGQPHKYQWRL